MLRGVYPNCDAGFGYLIWQKISWDKRCFEVSALSSHDVTEISRF